MRKRIYLAIIAGIKAANIGIKHFDKWNENTENLAQQNGYALPAVFIEFAPIAWQQRGGGVKSATARILLHIVTETLASAADGSRNQDDALEQFDTADAVVAAAQGLSGEGFNKLQHVTTETDHNHEQIQHDIEAFSCEIADSSAAKVRTLAEVKDFERKG